MARARSSDDPVCGWAVRGDRDNPCIRKPGHKSRHLSAAGREKQRAYFQATRDAQLRQQRAYYVNNREHILMLNKQWRADNAERDNELHRLWAANNAERIREIRRGVKHRRRARKLAVPHSDWTRQQLVELYGASCWLCGSSLPVDWHADHVIPISRGGWDVPTNLRPACPPCNRSKHDKLAGDPVVIFWALWSMAMGRLR